MLRSDDQHSINTDEIYLKSLNGRISDHDPVIKGQICSFNLMCQCAYINQRFYNNAFKISKETDEQYTSRLLDLVKEIGQLQKENKISIFLFQETPDPESEPGKQFYTALKKELPDFSKHFIAKTEDSRSCTLTMASQSLYPSQRRIASQLYERTNTLHTLVSCRGQMIEVIDHIGNTHTFLNVHANFRYQAQTLQDIQFCVENGLIIGGDFNIAIENKESQDYHANLTDEMKQEFILVKGSALEDISTYDGVINGEALSFLKYGNNKVADKHRAVPLVKEIEKTEDITPLLPFFISCIKNIEDTTLFLSLLTSRIDICVSNITTPQELNHLMGALQKAKFPTSSGLSMFFGGLFINSSPYDKQGKKILDRYIEAIKQDDHNPFLLHDRDQYHIIHHAARYGSVAIFKELLQKGKDINQKGPYGRTPLHIAAFNGHENMVGFLLANGANANLLEIQENFGEKIDSTSLQVALERAFILLPDKSQREKFNTYLNIIKTLKPHTNIDKNLTDFINKFHEELEGEEKTFFENNILSVFESTPLFTLQLN